MLLTTLLAYVILHPAAAADKATAAVAAVHPKFSTDTSI